MVKFSRTSLKLGCLIYNPTNNYVDLVIDFKNLQNETIISSIVMFFNTDEISKNYQIECCHHNWYENKYVGPEDTDDIGQFYFV